MAAQRDTKSQEAGKYLNLAVFILYRNRDRFEKKGNFEWMN